MWAQKELGTLLVSEQINKHCKDRLKRNCKTNIASIYNFLVIININYNFRGSFYFINTGNKSPFFWMVKNTSFINLCMSFMDKYEKKKKNSVGDVNNFCLKESPLGMFYYFTHVQPEAWTQWKGSH